MSNLSLPSSKSLKHLSTLKVAIELWNQENVINSIHSLPIEISNQRNSEAWQQLEDEVTEKVTQLIIPVTLIEDVLRFAHLSRLQIMNWWRYHRDNSLVLRMPKEFCWTPEGVIDKRRTAEILVRDEHQNVENRYKLACHYCFVPEIYALWKLIPVENVESYYSQNDALEIKQSLLVIFWTYQVKGQVSKLSYAIRVITGQSYPPRVYALHCAVEDGNLMATEFFFRKLNFTEASTCVVKFAKMAASNREQSDRNYYSIVAKDYHTQVLLFLMSRMTESQEVQLLERCLYEGSTYEKSLHQHLSGFLDPPLRPYFMRVVERVAKRNPTPTDLYHSLLRSVVVKIEDGWRDGGHRQFFQVFWKLMPLTFKKSAVERLSFTTLSKLIEIGEEEIVGALMGEAKGGVKKELVLSYEGREECKRLVRDKRWDTLKFLLERSLMSKRKLIKAKEVFVEMMKEDYSDDSSVWDVFFQLLDDIIEKKSRPKE